MAVKAPWYDRAMNTLKWLVIFTVLGYGVIVALLYFGQRAMQYFPERFRTAPAAAGLPEAQEVVLDTPDGERVIAWHVRPRGDKPVVLYFHGNGGSLRGRTCQAITRSPSAVSSTTSSASGRPAAAGAVRKRSGKYCIARCPK